MLKMMTVIQHFYTTKRCFFNCFFDNNGPVFTYNNTLNKTKMASHSTIFIKSLDEDDPATPMKDNMTETIYKQPIKKSCYIET